MCVNLNKIGSLVLEKKNIFDFLKIFFFSQSIQVRGPKLVVVVSYAKVHLWV